GVQILENNDRIEKSVSGYRIKGQMVALGPISQCRPVEEISKESEE
ncbi:MAG: sporulation protein, partial [Clostridium sp.]|nr:sporulation protein [Clostridium sp.]